MRSLLIFMSGLSLFIPLSGCNDTEDPDSRESRQANPIEARSHLPINVMLHNVQFISQDSKEKGLKPGPIAEGYEILTFGVDCIRREYGDKIQWMDMSIDQDGTFTATRRSDGMEMLGRFYPIGGEVTWQNKQYLLNIAAKGPDLSDPPSLEKISDGIRINLSSRKTQYMRHDTDEGSLSVQTHGHSGDQCVFDYTWEVEGRYSVYRHAIPISEKTVVIRCKNSSIGPRLDVSFNMSESKPVYSSKLFSGRTMLNRPWFRREVKGMEHAVDTMDLVSGNGPRLKEGSKIEISCVAYTDEYCNLRREGFDTTRKLSMVFSDENHSGGLCAALRYMRVGSWRRIRLNEGIAGPLRRLIRDAKNGEVLIVDIKLVEMK